MISENQIDRLIRGGEDRQLADRILANGRCPWPAVRRWLRERAAARPLALGLAVQRLCELCYGPSPQATSLVERLLVLQQPEGFFGRDGQPCLAATAVAGRALLDFAAHQRQAGLAPSPRVLNAFDHAIKALAAWPTGSLDPWIAGVVLWQLGDQPDCRTRLARHRLVELVSAGLLGMPRQAGLRDLGRIALAMAA